jgi:hypothetical protein
MQQGLELPGFPAHFRTFVVATNILHLCCLLLFYNLLMQQAVLTRKSHCLNQPAAVGSCHDQPLAEVGLVAALAWIPAPAALQLSPGASSYHLPQHS